MYNINASNSSYSGALCLESSGEVHSSLDFMLKGGIMSIKTM